MWARTGIRPLQLDGPECPDALAHVWAWYGQIAGQRTAGFGPNPLSYMEIAAWARLMRTDPMPLEVECLIALDRMQLSLMTAQGKKQTPAASTGRAFVAD